MKKPAVFIVFALLLALLPAYGAVAQEPSPDAPPLDDLVGLAQYFPADSPAFAVLRTDEAYFDELDAVIALVNRRLPLFPSDGGVRELLGELYEQFRPIATDSLAVGLDILTEETLQGSEPPLIIAFEIDSADAAQSFTAEIVDEDFEVTERNGFTIYIDEVSDFNRPRATYLFNDEVYIALLQYREELVDGIVSGDFATLGNSEGFTQAVANMPEPSYNIFTYVDVTALLTTIILEGGGMEADMADPTFEFNVATIESAGQFGAGFTILDGRTLTLDAVQIPGDLSYFEEIGIMPFDARPVNVDFAANLPANAQFVIQGTELGPQVIFGLDTLDALYTTIQDLAFSDPDALFNLSEEELIFLTTDFVGVIQGFSTVGFASLTGLNLQDDVLSWMDGDFAMALSVIPVDTDLTLSLDGVLVVQTSDPEASATLVDRIATASDTFNVEYVTEEFGDGNAVTLTAPLRLLLSQLDLPVDGNVLFNTPELDFLFGSNDSVFAMGSRPGVSYALDPAGDSLADNPTFVAASNYMLPNSVQFWYIGVPAIAEAIDDIALIEGDDEAQILGILGVFESATISGVQLADGQLVQRMTITLAE